MISTVSSYQYFELYDTAMIPNPEPIIILLFFLLHDFHHHLFPCHPQSGALDFRLLLHNRKFLED